MGLPALTADRLKTSGAKTRGWLTVAYLLAAVVLPCAHDHSGVSDEAVARHEAGCDDTRLHVSGHASPDLTHLQIDCHACQFRTSHNAWQFDPPTLFLPTVAAAVEFPSILSRSAASRLFSSRAPPRI